MAKLERKITGDFQEFVKHLKDSLLKSSFSATIEDESYFKLNEHNIAVISFERYSYLGSNRVGMFVSIASCNNTLAIVGMSAGGSQAVFLKLNRFGENAFLDKLRETIDTYRPSVLPENKK